MTFSKSEIYLFKKDAISKLFLDHFLERLCRQNIEHAISETATAIELTVWYNHITISDESIMEDDYDE